MLLSFKEGLIHSFDHLFIKQLLNTYHMPGTVLSITHLHDAWHVLCK